MADARENGRIGDLVAVEVEDRQHGAVAYRVDELVGVPGSGERSGLGFAVADDTGDDQVGIIEAGAVGVRQAVAEFAALMDGSRGFRSDMRADLAGEGELLEEFLQAFVHPGSCPDTPRNRCLRGRLAQARPARHVLGRR